jgi:hypothetical protein
MPLVREHSSISEKQKQKYGAKITGKQSIDYLNSSQISHRAPFTLQILGFSG